MSNIYLTRYGAVVNKSGGKIVVTNKDGSKINFPSSYVESLVIMANAKVTCEAIMEILHNGGSIIYLNKDGSIAGEMCGQKNKSRILVRQLKCYMDNNIRQQLANRYINKKITAQRTLIAEKNKKLKNPFIGYSISRLDTLEKNALNCTSIDEIMGVEGAASAIYFGDFDVFLKKSEFTWHGRIKRPAVDPVNSMLSFGYSLLEKDVRREISIAGLAPAIGFLHALDYRKDSLVYDVMECFRTMIDQFVFRCIGLKMIKPDDFSINQGKCFLTDDARRNFIKYYEDYIGALDDEMETKRSMITKEIKWLVKRLRELDKEMS